MARSNEPLVWAPFSAGGMITAILLPIHILLFGLLFPLGVLGEDGLSYEKLHALVTHPIGRAYVFVFVFLSLFHAGHRLRFALADLGLKPLAPLLNIVCYGGAVLGTVLCALTVLRL